MNELDLILEAWRGDRAGGAVLATVVHVEGSAYRRPGARMLIVPGGSRIGSISGGCLEGDVSRKAWWFTKDRRPAVRVYDTSSGDDAVWEFGLGCNGVIHVLLERIDTPEAHQTMQFLDRRRAARSTAALATVIATNASSENRIGDRVFFDPDGLCGGTTRDSSLQTRVLPQAQAALQKQVSRLVHFHDCDVFVEFIAPGVPLVVFGAGHDAVPLVAIGKTLGWHVTVADGRPAYARADRFPGADRVVLMANDDLLAGIVLGPDTVVVLMTHNYPQDARLLRGILPRNPRYLGVLGPRKRTERLLGEPGCGRPLADLHSPAGLDIGGDSPQAIALSVAAEIQARLSGRTGGMLKHRRTPIHPPVEESGEFFRESVPAPERATCELTYA